MKTGSKNVPFRTLLIEAMSNDSDNLYGVVSDVGTAGSVQVKLLGFDTPSPIANNDFSKGTSGWNIGNAPVQIVPHTEGIPGQAIAASSKFLSSRGAPPMAPAAPSKSTFKSKASGSVVDQDMVLTTSGEGVQSVSRTFNTIPGTTAVQIRYRFVTSEVPGGYFGSQYNDTFAVTLRNSQGGVCQ
jgi:hypothetical protein